MQEPYNPYSSNSGGQFGQPYYPPAGQYYAPQPPYYAPMPDPYENDRRVLRRHSVGVGLCIIAYAVIQQFFITLVVQLGLSDSYLNNAAFQYAFGAIFFSIAAVGLPFFILSLRKGSPSFIGVLPFNAPRNKSKAFYLVLFGLGVCMAANTAAAIFGDILSSVGIEESQTQSLVSSNAFEIFLNFLSTAAVPALVEEFAFRGVLMQPLRRYGEHFAVFASAFVFGLAHGSPTSFVFAFIVGITLGYAAVLSGSLWPGIAIHFLNNCFAVSITELNDNFAGMNDRIYWAIVSVIVVLAFGSLVSLLITRAFRLNESGSGRFMPTSKKIKAFFFSAPMLIAFAILLYYMILSIT